MKPLRLTLRKALTDFEVQNLTATYIDETHFDTLIEDDCDVYDTSGRMLAKFRKGVLPIETLKIGVDSFRGAIGVSRQRGDSGGGTVLNVERKDGTKSNWNATPPVECGLVGAIEGFGGLNPFCRLTAFTAKHFEQYKAGIPFVEAIDELYATLAPIHHKIQREYAKATNRNYIIGNTAFSTVTVNKNFRTAVHQDAGDLPKGFGNLIAYREGRWTGGYFCLPQYRVAFDLRNTDVLFVDVHKHHANTPFYLDGKIMDEWPEDQLRISFVLYYRQDIIKCASPSNELKRMKNTYFGFNKL